jgi:hypothetical protein
LISSSSSPFAAALDPMLAAGVLDEDAAHGLGGGREEVAAVVSEDLLVGADQAQIGLIHQVGRGERLPVGFVGQPTEFVVNDRQELGGGVGVAGLRRIEETGNRRHS